MFKSKLNSFYSRNRIRTRPLWSPTVCNSGAQEVVVVEKQYLIRKNRCQETVVDKRQLSDKETLGTSAVIMLYT